MPVFVFFLGMLGPAACGGGEDLPEHHATHLEHHATHFKKPVGPPPTPPPPSSDPTCPAYSAATPAALYDPVQPSTTAPVGTIPGSFTVTSTGEATYTMPLVTPPGRAGVEPQLALVYNSAGGNGTLGMGFSIAGLSAITRCPLNVADDEFIRGVRYDQLDRLCLDGRRLVPIARSVNTVEYRTFPDTFTKVVAHLDPNSKVPLYFEAFQRSGLIAEYGGEDSGKPLGSLGAPRAWWMTKALDRRGNAMTIKYRSDLDASNSVAVEHVPDEIRYTAFEGSPSLPASRAVKFVYEPRDADDVRTLFTYGLRLRSSLRLHEIRMLGPGDQIVRRYGFTYQLGAATKRTRLAGVEECAADSICKPPTRFAYSDHPAGFHKLTTPLKTPLSSRASPMLLDFNGDGLDDLVIADTDLATSADTPITNWNVAENRGLFLNPAHLFTTPALAATQDPGINVPGAGPTDMQPEVGTAIDYDQDGVTDLFLHDILGVFDTWHVLIAKPGHGFVRVDTGIKRPFPIGVSPSPPSLTSSAASVHLADLDGDGVPDLIQCSDHAETLTPDPSKHTWTLHLWRPQQGKKAAGFDAAGQEISPLLGYPCNVELHTVDIDGDGKVNLVVASMINAVGGMLPGGTYSAVSLVRGSEWEVADTNLPVALQASGGRMIFLDVNGDGLPDAVQTGFGDMPRTFFNTGAGFLSAVPGLAAPLLPNPDPLFSLAVPIDFNGDGRQDLLVPVPPGTLPGQSLTLPTWAVLQSTGAIDGPTFEILDPHIPFEAALTQDGIKPEDPHGARIDDINDDGAPDVMLLLGGHFTVFQGTAADQDLLVQVSDGLNDRDPSDPAFVPDVAITYSHLADHTITDGKKAGSAEAEPYAYASRSDPSNPCAYPVHCAVGPRRVVDGYAVNNGADRARRFSVRYRDGRYHRLGRGFLGFGERIVTDVETLAATADFYDNRTYDPNLRAYPNAGQPVREWRWTPGLPTQPDPHQIELSFLDVELTTVPTNGGATYFTLPTYHEVRRAQGSYPPAGKKHPTLAAYAAEVAEHGGATLMSDTVTSVWDYDAFGNVLAENTVTGGIAFGSRVQRAVENDVAKWLLGQVKHESACSTTVGEEQCRTHDRFYDVFGEVYRETTGSDDGSDETKLDVSYTRDGFGNVTKTAADDAFGHHRASCTTFEPEGIFPYAGVNAAGHVSFSRFDPGLGVLVAAVDPNQLVTRLSYDGLGRIGQQTHPDATKTTYARETILHGNGTRHVTSRVVTDGGADDTTEYDSLGRPIRWWWYGPQTPAPTNPACPACLPGPPRIMQEIVFDDLGEHVARRSVPESESTPPSKRLYDEYLYDAAGRVVEHTTPWGAVTQTAFWGTSVEVIDALGFPTFIEHDALGRPLAIMDGAGGITRYDYGHFGALRSVTDPGGAVMGFARDAYERVVQLDDPDRGTTITHYDGFDELTSSSDALGRVATLQYDLLGRLVTRTEQDGPDTETTTWTWDSAQHGIGKLAQLANDDAKKTYGYDALGRTRSVRLELTGDPAPLVSTLDYDAFGRVQKITYPGSTPFAVTQDHDAYGHVTAVRDAGTSAAYWQLTDVDGAGRVTTETFGNGTVTGRLWYSDRERVKSIFTVGSSILSPIQNLTYEYDPRQSLARRTDALQQQHKTERFRYDALDRLRCAYFGDKENPKAPCAQAYEYDPNGNLMSKAGIGTLSYADDKHPHAVTSAGSDVFGYDDAGNQVTRPGGINVKYTPFDLPRTITGGGKDASFAYDGDRRRVRKSAGGIETVYFDELYERIRLASTGPMTLERFYVHSPERAVAIITRGGPAPGTRYLHTDHLGSVDAVTDESGHVVERRSYDPFGAQRSPTWGDSSPPLPPKTTVGFTGHEGDDDLGLVNMKGRIYDPRLGRFLTPDPLVARPLFGQSWNRYTYVHNNPLAYVDPSGFEEELTAREQRLFDRGGGGLIDDGKLTGVIAREVVVTGQPLPPEPPKTTVEKGVDISQSVAAGAARAPNDVGTLGNTMGRVPETPEEGRQVELPSPGQAAVRGFIYGGMLGAIPFAGLGHQFFDAAHALPNPGTPEWRRGVAIGQIVTGFGLMIVGGLGDGFGAALSFTGIGAFFGVPAMAVSTTLLVGGVANVASGLQALMSTGSGSKPSPAIKPGSSGGSTAGQRFSEKVRQEAFAENPEKTCVYCQRDGTATQVDHADPRSKGGNATPENAQLACPHCNASKGANPFPRSPPAGYSGPWPPPHWGKP